MIRKKKRFITHFISFVVFFVCFVFFATKRSNADKSVPNEFSFIDLDNKEFAFKTLNDQSQLTIICFISIFHPPSLEQLFMLREIQNIYQKQEVSVIFISVDSEINQVRGFVHRNKVQMPVFQVSPSILDVFGEVTVVPSIFVIDQNLKIIYQKSGYISREFLENKINYFLRNINN